MNNLAKKARIRTRNRIRVKNLRIRIREGLKIYGSGTYLLIMAEAAKRHCGTEIQIQACVFLKGL
jgi:hypothetical protein